MRKCKTNLWSPNLVTTAIVLLCAQHSALHTGSEHITVAIGRLSLLEFLSKHFCSLSLMFGKLKSLRNTNSLVWVNTFRTMRNSSPTTSKLAVVTLHTNRVHTVLFRKLRNHEVIRTFAECNFNGDSQVVRSWCTSMASPPLCLSFILSCLYVTKSVMRVPSEVLFSRFVQWKLLDFIVTKTIVILFSPLSTDVYLRMRNTQWSDVNI